MANAPLLYGSEEVENGADAIIAEAGRWGFFATGGRNTTGAVADLLVMKPGAKGRAVRLRTLLDETSGIGDSEGAADVGGMTMLAVPTPVLLILPVAGIPNTATGAWAIIG